MRSSFNSCVERSNPSKCFLSTCHVLSLVVERGCFQKQHKEGPPRLCQNSEGWTQSWQGIRAFLLNTALSPFRTLQGKCCHLLKRALKRRQMLCCWTSKKCHQATIVNGKGKNDLKRNKSTYLFSTLNAISINYIQRQIKVRGDVVFASFQLLHQPLSYHLRLSSLPGFTPINSYLILTAKFPSSCLPT